MKWTAPARVAPLNEPSALATTTGVPGSIPGVRHTGQTGTSEPGIIQAGVEVWAFRPRAIRIGGKSPVTHLRLFVIGCFDALQSRSGL
jgi:hypothetical protein